MTEEEHLRRRDMMLAAGWTELATGVYSCKPPKVDRESESYKRLEKEFQEFKERKERERMTITDIIRNNNIAKFSSYRQGVCQYTTEVNGTPYIFPVNVESVDQASLFAEMKCIHLMPQLRKALEEGTFLPTRREMTRDDEGRVVVSAEDGTVIGRQG